MAKFAVFFTFRGETIKGLMDKPATALQWSAVSVKLLAVGWRRIT
jgi:hypothetical protein